MRENIADADVALLDYLRRERCFVRFCVEHIPELSTPGTDLLVRINLLIAELESDMAAFHSLWDVC